MENTFFDKVNGIYKEGLCRKDKDNEYNRKLVLEWVNRNIEEAAALGQDNTTYKLPKSFEEYYDLIVEYLIDEKFDIVTYPNRLAINISGWARADNVIPMELNND